MRKSVLADKQKLKELCEVSLNMADLLARVGLKPANGNYVTLRKYLDLYSLKIQDDVKFRRRGVKLIYSDEQCFSVNSTISRQHVKRRILKGNLITYICNKCG